MDVATKMTFRPICEQSLTTILTGESTDAASLEVLIHNRRAADY